jgi:hypothetical protein
MTVSTADIPVLHSTEVAHLYPPVMLPICHGVYRTPYTLSAFRDRGVPGPTSEMSPRAPAQMGRREAEHEGGKRRPEAGVREVEIPRPLCSSRA